MTRKILGLFTEVREDEVPTLLLLTLDVFLLLTAYYLIKPVREALILADRGAEVKSYAAAGQVAILALTVPLYARLAARWSRRRLLRDVTLFFALCLVGFWVLAASHVPVGIAFFLWVGVFNVVVVAQFWSFANDVYSREAGERLFAVVAFGASFGAVFGSWVAGQAISLLGIHAMMPLAAAVLVASLAIALRVETRERPPARERSDELDRGLGQGDAFAMILRDRYLRLLAAGMLLLNLVNTNGEYVLGRVVEESGREALASGAIDDLGAYIGGFYSDFFTGVNGVALAVQILAVSRIIRYLGITAAVSILPVISMGAYAILVFHPALGIVRWAKTAENSTNYSLQNTVRNVLFLPTSREQKYKAKQAIDTFFVRLGDVGSAALVFLGAGVLSVGVPGFAILNLALCVAWLAISVATARRYGDASNFGNLRP